MDDLGAEFPVQTDGSDQSDDLRKRIVETSQQGAENSQHDVSRNVLHYGESHEGGLTHAVEQSDGDAAHFGTRRSDPSEHDQATATPDVSAATAEIGRAQVGSDNSIEMAAAVPDLPVGDANHLRSQVRAPGQAHGGPGIPADVPIPGALPETDPAQPPAAGEADNPDGPPADTTDHDRPGPDSPLASADGGDAPASAVTGVEPVPTVRQVASPGGSEIVPGGSQEIASPLDQASSVGQGLGAFGHQPPIVPSPVAAPNASANAGASPSSSVPASTSAPFASSTPDTSAAATTSPGAPALPPHIGAGPGDTVQTFAVKPTSQPGDIAPSVVVVGQEGPSGVVTPPSDNISDVGAPQDNGPDATPPQNDIAPVDAPPPPQDHIAPVDAPPPPQDHIAPVDAPPPPQDHIAPVDAPPPPQNDIAPVDAPTPPQNHIAPVNAPPPPEDHVAPVDTPPPPEDHVAPVDTPPPPQNDLAPVDAPSPHVGPPPAIGPEVGPVGHEAPQDEPSDPNEAPTAIRLDGGSVAENAAGAVVGAIAVEDPDAGDSHVFAVSDARFEVSEGQLRLKDGVSLDHEEAASLTVTVTATDSDGAQTAQSFDVAVTDVNEAPTAIRLDGGSVAENAAGAVVGAIAVEDPDAGDSHVFAVSDARFEVSEGQLRLKDGVSLDHEEAASLTVTVTATDSDGAQTAQSFDVAVTDLPEASMTTGFKISHFEVANRRVELDEVDWSGRPIHQDIVSDIDHSKAKDTFWGGGYKNVYAAKIEGCISVEEEGTFTFHHGAEDGAMLFVNGQPVIRDDGARGPDSRLGHVDLEPGTHSIEVLYLENRGRPGLKLEWEGPGIDGRQVVQASEALHADENGTLNVRIDLSGASEDAEIAISGLPAETILSSGTNIIVTDGTPVDVSDWNLGLLEIDPPANYHGSFPVDVIIRDLAENGEPVESIQSFDMSVGDFSVGGDGDGTEEMILIAENHEAPGTDWMTGLDSADADATDETDVFSEDIFVFDDAGSGEQATETYERQDW